MKTANLAVYTCRLIARLIHARVQAGRHFVVYDSPSSEIWFAELCLEWYVANFRWCIMGVKDPETEHGFRAGTMVLSSAPLWNDAGPSDKCSCLEGPGHVKDPLNVLRARRLMVETWVKINTWIYARRFSC